MGLFRFKIRKYFRSQEDFFGKSLLLYMVIYGIIYKAIYYLIYFFLKQESIFLSLVSESPIFLKNGKNFYFLPCVPKKTIFFSSFYLSCGRKFRPQVLSLLSIYLVVQILHLKFIGAKLLPLSLPLPLPLSSQGKKKDWVLRYSIPEFLVISFADSVAVFDSLSDCSFLCQYWYFC